MDTIFYNGIISTLDDRDSVLEAVGVQDGLICFIGTNEEANGVYANYFRKSMWSCYSLQYICSE